MARASSPVPPVQRAQDALEVVADEAHHGGDAERRRRQRAGTCRIEASWQVPAEPPPHQVVFAVEAAGQRAEAGPLKLVMDVTARLVLDDEPAAEVDVILKVAPSGEAIRGRTNADGVVEFKDAPAGEWSLVLDAGP